MRNIIGVIATVVIIVVGGLIAWPYLQGGPRGPATRFLTALSQKDLTAARELVAPEGKAVTDEQLRRVVSEGVAPNIGDVIISSETTAQVSFTSGGKTSQLMMSKQTGTWLVVGEVGETFSAPAESPKDQQKLDTDWDKAAAQFMEAVIAGSTDEAAAVLTTKGQAGKAMLAEWAASWGNRKGMGMNFYARIQVTTSESEGEERIVKAEFANLGRTLPTRQTAPTGAPGGGGGGGGGGPRGGGGGGPRGGGPGGGPGGPGRGPGGPGGGGAAAPAEPRYFAQGRVDMTDQGVVEVYLRKEGDSWRVRQTISIPKREQSQGVILDQEAIKKNTIVRDYENPPKLEGAATAG